MGLVGIAAVWLYFLVVGLWIVLPITGAIGVVYAILNALKVLVTGRSLQTGRVVGTAPLRHQLKLMKYALFMGDYPGAVPGRRHAA